MPTADYSSYHQASGTGADGTKFSNFIDAVQATVNALDKNNLAASAGILASQLADPTTGKVLGSSASACAAVYPPGYELAYAEVTTTSTNITVTSEGTATTFLTATSFTADGSAVWVDAYIPAVDTPALAGQNIYLVLFEGATSKGNLARRASAAAATDRAEFVGRRKLSPSAGATVYTLKAYVDSGTGVLRAGAGSAGVEVPAFIRVTKA